MGGSFLPPHPVRSFPRGPRRCLPLLALGFLCAPFFPQATFSLAPSYLLPFGAVAAAYEPLRLGAALDGRLPLRSGPLSLNLGLGGQYLPLADASSVLALSGGGGLGFGLPLGPRLSLASSLTGGASWVKIAAPGGGLSGFGAWGSLAFGLDFPLGSLLAAGPRLALRYDTVLGFFLESGASLSFRPGEVKPRVPAAPKVVPLAAPKAAKGNLALAVDPAAPGTVFPVFYAYYDDHPLGTVRVRNAGAEELTDLRVSFYLKQFMDGPRESPPVALLKPGESVELPLLAILTDRILEVTEGTKAQAEIKVSASAKSGPREASQTASIRIADRNAMTWIDDRAAAAFITAKDPSILGFAKSTMGGLRPVMNPALNQNLMAAMAIHEALSAYGLGYVIDPKSAYGAATTGSIDFLLFPRQTLEYRAGDCDDLSILYCALLEAVGVETAFITVPGHIYMAASLGIGQEEARKAFKRTDELIIRDNVAWLPIEVTMRTGGFLAAWQEGAKQWRESAAREQAGFFPIHEAWKTFEPVGIPGSAAIQAPDLGRLSLRFTAESVRFVDKEIADQVSKLQGQLRTAQDESKPRNDLGVLYARYGLFDRARTEFEKASQKKDYVPALVNLGHLHFRAKELEKALAFYEKAWKAQPTQPLVLLSMARVSHDLENYGAARKYYAELKVLDPRLAEQFAYIELKGEEGNRAADISGAREVLEWMQ